MLANIAFDFEARRGVRGGGGESCLLSCEIPATFSCPLSKSSERRIFCLKIVEILKRGEPVPSATDRTHLKTCVRRLPSDAGARHSLNGDVLYNTARERAATLLSRLRPARPEPQTIPRLRDEPTDERACALRAFSFAPRESVYLFAYLFGERIIFSTGMQHV